MLHNLDKGQGSYRFALFHLAFRPFFLGAAFFSFFSVLIWGGVYFYDMRFTAYGLPAVLWHAHEMVYGYGLAVIAGFLLTAVKNWTGIQTVHGRSLALLFFLWLLARVLPLLGDNIPILWIGLIDNLFILLLFLGVALPVFKVRQWAHASILVILLLFFVGNSLFYLGIMGMVEEGVHLSLYSGIYLIMLLIFVMGSRVIPFFIEKGVNYPVKLNSPKWLEVSSIFIFIIFCITDLFIKDVLMVSLLSGLLFVVHTLRLMGWHTHGIWKKPLLWVLFVAYCSIILGFLLKAVVPIFDISPYLAVHAFTYGGIGIMTLGMMGRVAYGHTGRDVFNPPAMLFWIFVLLAVGLVFRVLLPLLLPGLYVPLVGASMLFWLTAFLLFFIIYLPILVKPRVDGRYG